MSKPKVEPLYQCPRCRNAPRQKGEWATRYGIITCGACLKQGYIILPDKVPSRALVDETRT